MCVISSPNINGFSVMDSRWDLLYHWKRHADCDDIPGQENPSCVLRVCHRLCTLIVIDGSLHLAGNTSLISSPLWDCLIKLKKESSYMFYPSVHDKKIIWWS